MSDLTRLVFDGERLRAEFEVGAAISISALGVNEEKEVKRLLELFHFSYNQIFIRFAAAIMQRLVKEYLTSIRARINLPIVDY
jgi:hypothetical protein